MAFRLNRRDVFLTYSRTPKNFNPQLVLRKLSEKAEIEQYCIAQEKHAEVKRRPFHIHAYIQFEEKVDIKNQEYFDLSYYGVNYHPNIQAPKKKHLVLRYIRKDGQFIENFDSRPLWLKLIQDFPDETDFLQEILYHVNRIDNYAGYRTLRDLYQKYHSIDIGGDTRQFLKRSKTT